MLHPRKPVHVGLKADQLGQTPVLQLWLLGPLKAFLNDTPLPPLPTRYARTLLARLALAHPHAVSRARLCADLFPAAPPDSAARHLRTTLYYLRRALGDYLRASHDDVALDPRLVIEHDVATFTAASRPGVLLATLEAAVHCYRGPFLAPAAVEGWAAEQAQRLHTQYIELLRQVVTLAPAAGAPAVALDAAQRWLAEEL